MAADWDAIDDALIAWVERTANLTGKVIWDQQPGGTRPERPFATLRSDGRNTLGVGADVSVTDNGPDAPSGEEITLRAGRQKEFTLTVTVYTAEVLGTSSAFRRAERVHDSVDDEETLNNFDELGLALIDRAPVMNVSDMLDTSVEGQAVFDVRLRAGDETEELTTWIETATMTGEVE
jgi:hypothetical protein